MSKSIRPSYPTDQPVNTPSWSVIWFNALRRPYVTTYEEFICNSEASSQRAYIWVFASTLLACFIIVFNPYGRFKTLSLGSALVTITVLTIVSFVWFILLAGFTQLIARAVDGESTYANLVYAMACFHAPLTIVRSFFITSPIIEFAFFLFGLYLTAVAIKAVHKFNWRKTAVVTTILYLVLFIFIVVLAIVIVYVGRRMNVTPSFLIG